MHDRGWEWLAGRAGGILPGTVDWLCARAALWVGMGHVASFIMNAEISRNAGSELMEAANPEAWRIFRSDFRAGERQLRSNCSLPICCR